MLSIWVGVDVSYLHGDDQKKATGFEEYYVDAPMTPEQHHEEKSIYDPYVM